MHLYALLSRIRFLNYSGKILVVTFFGIHVPLIVLILYFAINQEGSWRALAPIVFVVLAATLVGTAITLFVLNQLLAPIMAASKALGDYRTRRALPELPREFEDEAGALMRDTDVTIRDLDTALKRLTHFDPVSMLGRRPELIEQVESLIAKGDPIAGVCVRISNFAEIETLMSFEATNRVILTLAERLQEHAGASALGRTSSATFKFAMPLADPAALHRHLEALHGHLTAPIRYGRSLYYPKISIGVACFPEHAAQAAELLSAALSAATVQNFNTGAAVSYFSEVSNDTARRRFMLDQDLRQALKRGEFELHYQPIVDAELSSVVAAEALIRWRHPQLGNIPPSDFIAIAEESGLIIQLGEFTFNAACNQIRTWKAGGHEAPRISINLSAEQFRDPDLVHKIDHAVGSAGIRHADIKIEITESVLLTDLPHVEQSIGQLRDRGVGISLDDFGADYSNMRYVANFNFDEMKIDRMFVQDVDRDQRLHAICTSIATLSRGLGIQLVAEGVERAEELAALMDVGCRLFQGYHFARPVPAHLFPEECRKAVAALAPRVDTAA
ncbi:putative bifunctional diguanylate cyclase/phosphodiesterase [Amorphus orientalis]|uniref:EAL domain-containing protein (Putative c-di-GMP-specific phosphodiesterase class I)/GGDEF domain-containing protein n=1 Tax=Amorphus orientalis TaxID=649198 RepID=A0AAE4ART1_9HYPH|nr:GGDEF domain-containing phosphodiesterase [Amorphus orientalis]MDQ0314428.1 EAL domain-containing protein (putative c-di-GMP-specific phosphodiesterase class I)/GGDEF domain-containing protein [Amorphus orientalis]